MPKIMLINVTHSEESRVGILSEGVLESFEIESLGREHLKGNIYKGVVHRIHPALEAAFVNIGSDRDAFLPLDEICFRNVPNPPSSQGGDGDNGRRRRRIRDVLRPGEEILVQITKEQFANKPPTLTTFFSLPGRYLVLLPGSPDSGISRRIEGEERVRLRKLLDKLDLPEDSGVIVRTAAGLDESSGEFGQDLTYLQRLWESIQRAAEGKRAPALVYREHDIVLRTIRDFFTPDIDEIYVDNEEVYERAREFLHSVLPAKEHVLRFYDGDQPIFSAFDVESQIESIFKRRVQLPSGGSIVIDGTEALTAIDVNSGGSVRGPNPEETAFRTNREAASQVARQLKLRDIGGLIVVDFIDMRDHAHIQEIERLMRDALHPDKARHEVGRISRFGLMEISRQRMRPAATTNTYTACPMCEGHGAVRTTESAALVALRKIHNRVAHGDVATVNVDLPAPVAVYLLNQKRDELARLEQRYNTRLQVNLSADLMPHQVNIEVRERRFEEVAPPVVAPGEVAPKEVKAPPAARAAAPADATEALSGKKRRRRRGRRKSPSLRAAEAIGEALVNIGKHRGLSSGEAEPCAAPSAHDAQAPPPPAPVTGAATVAGAQPTGEKPAPSGTRSRRRGGRGRSAAKRRAAREATSKPGEAPSAAPAPAGSEAPPASPPADVHAQTAAARAAAAIGPTPGTPTEKPEAAPSAPAAAKKPRQRRAASGGRRPAARKKGEGPATGAAAVQSPPSAQAPAKPAPVRKPRRKATEATPARASATGAKKRTTRRSTKGTSKTGEKPAAPAE